MALDTFVAGPYSATFDAADVGITENGYELQQECNLQEISGSDAYGDSVIDAVFRGGNVHLQFESKAYKAGSIAAAWPYAAQGVLCATTGVGTLVSDNLAKATVLTKRLSATAPATLTASKSALAPNFPVRLLFDSRLRQVPVRKRLYPYVSTNVIFFSLT
jgi:hypothetical protein